MSSISTKIFPKSGSWKQRHYPKPGSAEYDEHIQEEIEHFCKLFEESSARETLFYSVPPSWAEVEVRASAMIQAATGNDLNGHVVTRLNSRPGLRMLSLGAGSGGVEITLAQQARYLGQATALFRRDARVDLFVWFVFRDSAGSSWQSGLYRLGWAPKYALFRRSADRCV